MGERAKKSMAVVSARTLLCMLGRVCPSVAQVNVIEFWMIVEVAHQKPQETMPWSPLTKIVSTKS